jgi:hypothetical protein
MLRALHTCPCVVLAVLIASAPSAADTILPDAVMVIERPSKADGGVLGEVRVDGASIASDPTLANGSREVESDLVLDDEERDASLPADTYMLPVDDSGNVRGPDGAPLAGTAAPQVRASDWLDASVPDAEALRESVRSPR